MVVKSILDLVGNTPLLQAERFSSALKLKTTVFAKLEYLNPTGSVKDRVAKNILLQAWDRGEIHKDSVLIEPTSGNTGIGLAAMGKALGLRVIITMPETMSVERQKLIRAYGAEVILTDGAKGMKGAIEQAELLAKETPNAFILGQFVNPDNPGAHYLTTGPEIWEDLEQVDILIAGVGTGGTISGAGKYLKEKNPKLQIIAVEPAKSPILTKGYSGSHGIQGIGAGFIPKTLDVSCYDRVLDVADEDALAMAKLFMETEGISIGISSGAALFAAVCVARESQNENKNIVVILPDSGDRYLSTELFL